MPRPNYNPNGIITKDPVTGDFRTFRTPINGTGIVVTPLGTNGSPLPNSMPGGGNLGRNTFRGPSLQNWNFSVMKKVSITEGWQLQLRSDFFNIWNHAAFSSPQASGANCGGSCPTYGIVDVSGGDSSILTTANRPRIIQFAVKYSF